MRPPLHREPKINGLIAQPIVPGIHFALDKPLVAQTVQQAKDG